MSAEVTSGVLVKMKHIRPICWDGTKRWCDLHGIDPRRFREGVPVEEVEATGDKVALEVAKRAREDQS